MFSEAVAEEESSIQQIFDSSVHFEFDPLTPFFRSLGRFLRYILLLPGIEGELLWWVDRICSAPGVPRPI